MSYCSHGTRGSTTPLGGTMNAATLQAGSIGFTTAAAPTNGPSSSVPTTGSGQVAVSTNQAFLGEQVLPAPIGEPQTIHLPDGSMLVPVARVDASGARIPLTGGAGSAQYVSTGSTVNHGGTGGGTLHAGEGAQITSDGRALADSDFEPLGILYNGNYYKRYFDGGGLDVNDRNKLEERATESTYLYLKDKEPEVDDFGISGISLRRVEAGRDTDLLHVNPRAMWVMDVHGIQGDGVQRTIPTIINSDGATYTDPRMRSM